MECWMDFEVTFDDFLMMFVALSATLQNHVFLAQFHRFTWFGTSEKTYMFTIFLYLFGGRFLYGFVCILAWLLAPFWILRATLKLLIESLFALGVVALGPYWRQGVPQRLIFKNSVPFRNQY